MAPQWIPARSTYGRKEERAGAVSSYFAVLVRRPPSAENNSQDETKKDAHPEYGLRNARLKMPRSGLRLQAASSLPAHSLRPGNQVFKTRAVFSPHFQK